MAEDRFANVFTAEVTESAAGTLTWIELAFGITLRDKIAVVIDELYIYVPSGIMDDFTALSDEIAFGLSMSDQVTNIFSAALDDRRILYMTSVQRQDFGTAAGGQFIRFPLKESFSPPLIVLPNRLFFGVQTNGLATAGTAVLRMHYRTISITQDQQLIEILEAFQMSI